MRINLHATLIFLLLYLTSVAAARDYIIFSITKDFPMYAGETNIKKNYYINMGKDQGLKEGSVLNVYRFTSEVDPYENKKRYEYRIKIGQLEVIHSDKGAAITKEKSLLTNEIYLDVPNFMVGDQIEVSVKD
jgi:hypothetical protein